MVRSRSAAGMLAGVVLWAISWGLPNTAGAAKDEKGPALAPFAYVEDFEKGDPVRAWASNGEAEVHFKGMTEEKAATGKRSFKLDITIKSGSYHYWRVPVRVPCEGTLKFSGKVLVAECKGASVGLGGNYVFPPTAHSGCGTFGRFNGPTDGWQRQEADLVERGQASGAGVVPRHVNGAGEKDAGAYVSDWGIFVYGRKGARVVIYVDDVRIEGEAPSIEAYDAEVRERWSAHNAEFRKRIAEWREELHGLQAQAAEMADIATGGRNLKQAVDADLAAADKMLRKFEKDGWATPGAVATMKHHMASAANMISIAKEVAAGGPSSRCLIHVPEAITNKKILPDDFPVDAPLSDKVRVVACRDEYESATFVIFALRDLEDVTVDVTDLISAERTVPSDAVDVRVVKCWYQSGVNIWSPTRPILTPELLLKDDGLMRVDREKKQNFLRHVNEAGETTYVPISGPTSDHLAGIQPKDSDRLLPVTIPAWTAKQFWLTVHVPADAAAGTYVGTIRLRAGKVQLPSVILSVRVLPFDLVPAPLTYSIYYRGRLTRDGKGSISSEAKSPEQYLAEMADMKAHGVLYPTVYQGWDKQLLRQLVELREQAGLPKGLFFGLGQGTGAPKGQGELNALGGAVKRWRAFLAPLGYDDVYFYGRDEAQGERLKAQRQAWKAVQDAGGKTFVACYRKTFEAMGDLLDVAIWSGGLDPKEAEKYHKVGSRIFSYGNPQVGLEQPVTYRRNFGLLLWKAGYDGAMDYAYQHGFGHIWNEFDHKTRDHVFAYPTADGVIDTIQWEGFREGVDDVRYAATLEKAIREAEESPGPTAPEVAKAYKVWLTKLDVSGDLSQIRREMTARTMLLEAFVKSDQ